MLAIFQANRLEELAAPLVERLGEAGAAPLEAQCVVVPSAGMARWLQYAIARRHGVCAQVEFPYPAQFVWRLFARLLPEVPASSPFDPDILAWRLFGLFGELPAGAELAPLRAYLGAADARARMQLARRVAALFDRYLVHRADWLQAWAAGRRRDIADGRHEAWQAVLWREILRRSASPHGEHPKEAFFTELARRVRAGEPVDLPQRIAVFGVPLLPPLYLEILVRLSEFSTVELYVLNPCREFWADVLAEREIARLRLRGDSQAALREVGHPLLAAWGRQSRDQLALLGALTGEEGVVDAESFRLAPGECLLARLQNAITCLGEMPARPPAEDDRSIQVHACHSLTRQLEVLHDHLLALFERHPDLAPGDILVMTPDLDAAAPLVEAVFGAVPRARAIAYAVRGRSAGDASELPRAFARLLALPDSRFEAAGVMDLLRSPPVARRFDLDEAELEQLRDWLRETGVRWGLDAAQRAGLGLPAESAHSWAAGLARLLLGYALPGEGRGLFAGLLPWDDIEGGAALALGKLLRFLQTLVAFSDSATRARPPAAWAQLLHTAAGDFFAPREAEEADLARLRAAIAAVAAAAAAAGHEGTVPLELVRELLAEQLAAAAPGAVPTGAVTFCALGALRGLPYRVVCLVGLDADAFPRSPVPLEFDLMDAAPRLGDRARREDDRGAFLDALLAARDVFWLGYTGRDLRDDSPLPPSVLVAELLDYLAPAVAGGARTLVSEHPLQPFSPRAFVAPRPSYVAEYLDAARACQAGPLARRAAQPLMSAPLPPPQAEWREVDGARLAGFFGHPVRFLLRERLRIQLDEAEAELAASEPFALDGIEGWRLGERLLDLVRAGLPRGEIEAIARAGPELPHGAPGELALAAALGEAEAFAAALRRLEGGAALPPLAYELDLGEFRLAGSLGGLSAAGLLRHRLAKERMADLVAAWLDHLLLNCLAPAGVAPMTRHLAKDALVSFQPVAAPADELRRLLEHYWSGLSAPLPLPPRSALAWLRKGAGAAQRAWTGNGFRDGECADPWYRLLNGGVAEALPPDFERVAADLLGPLQAHCSVLPVPEVGAP